MASPESLVPSLSDSRTVRHLAIELARVLGVSSGMVTAALACGLRDMLRADARGARQSLLRHLRACVLEDLGRVTPEDLQTLTLVSVRHLYAPDILVRLGWSESDAVARRHAFEHGWVVRRRGDERGAPSPTAVLVNEDEVPRGRSGWYEPSELVLSRETHAARVERYFVGRRVRVLVDTLEGPEVVEGVVEVFDPRGSDALGSRALCRVQHLQGGGEAWYDVEELEVLG